MKKFLAAILAFFIVCISSPPSHGADPGSLVKTELAIKAKADFTQTISVIPVKTVNADSVMENAYLT